MASLGGTYSAEGGQTMGDRGVLPAGDYVAALVQSERREAKAGNGNAYINLEFEVQDGAHQGRRFWSMLNLWNNNAQAVEIAQRALNSICQACGKLRVSDTEELHGIPMTVKLRVKADGQYGDKNTVAGYAPLNAGRATFAGAGAGGAVTGAPAAAGNQPPWKRTA